MKARPWVWLLLVFALLATACGGEVDESADDGDETEAVDDAPAEDNETAADEPEPETEEDPGTAETEDGPNTYDDPRGGIFAEFQAGFDRGDHPFTQLDAFCVAHDAAQTRRQPTTVSRPTRSRSCTSGRGWRTRSTSASASRSAT